MMNKLRNLYKREYRIWKAMRARCNASCYSDSTYQSRGVKVCSRWNSFENFIIDMGVCPSNMSIDRIDPYGDYCPENCRWATSTEQSRNRGSFNILYTYNGVTHCLKEWAEILHIKYTTLYNRIKRHPEMSFEEVVSYSDPRTHLYVWEGEEISRQELGERYNIPLANFYDRVRKGWPLKKILLTPINHKI